MAEQLSLDRTRTAVIIMDYQYRQLNMLPEEERKALIARANQVLAQAREKALPVIFVEVQWGERMPETEMHRGIPPQPGEPILTKHRTGPFSTTNLDNILKSKDIRTLVLLGVRTSGCVLSAVRWAADIDYKLIVLSDCCADPDAEVHRVLMEKIFPRQANVITAERFSQALSLV